MGYLNSAFIPIGLTQGLPCFKGKKAQDPPGRVNGGYFRLLRFALKGR